MSWLNYSLTLVVVCSIYVIVAVGLNLVAGYCGRLTLAQGGVYGAGAYAYAIVANSGWPMSPYIGLVVAGCVGAILSLALSLPERRLRGDFFVIASLALQAILFAAFKNWQTPDEPIGTWRNLTNGTAGILGVLRPQLFGSGLAPFAIFTAATAAVTVIVVLVLVDSPWGRLIRASRDDRLVAEGLGKPVFRARVQAFAISGATAAFAGALYAAYAGYVSPDVGSIDVSVLFLSMVLIGGIGTLRGPLVGAALLLCIEEVLRLLKVADFLKRAPLFSTAMFTDANLQLLTYGLLLVFLLRFRPEGLVGDPAAGAGREVTVA